MTRCFACLATCLSLFLAGCGTGGTTDVEDPPPLPTGDNASPKKSGVAADESDAFLVKFETSKGDFTVRVVPAWAPEGAKRIRELVEGGVYDGAKFFRVVPGFMVQFGIPGDPKLARQWEKKVIPDDKFVKSNQRGYVTFATSGPNSRTSQIFVNYDDNSRLDPQGFTPFGEVIDDGMKVVDAIESRYGEKPNQGLIQSEGNVYLDRDFPDLDFIKTAKIVTPGEAKAATPKTETPKTDTPEPKTEKPADPETKKDETKPEPKDDAKPETKPETKDEAKPEKKDEPKPDAKKE